MDDNNEESGRRGSWMRTKGADRRGIRASNLVLEACADNDITGPRFEYPTVLITSARYTVDDDMTALDQAIYFYMVARLRDQVNVLNSINTAVEKHSALWRHDLRAAITVRDVVAFTGVANLVRIKASLGRIAKAQIGYDLRRRHERDLGPKHLMILESLPDRLTINDSITYTIDRAVRAAVALAKRYVYMDLNVFPRFRCRYTPRLYARLAIHATIDREHRRPWAPEVSELANILGYPARAFHRGNFIKTIERVIAEIAALPEVNRRFDVGAAMPDVTNGRFRFQTGSPRKALYDARPQPTPGIRSRLARHQGADSGLNSTQNLRASQFGHAAAFTGADPAELVTNWHRDVSIAHTNPAAHLGNFLGSELLGWMKRYGPGAAFEHWLFLRGYVPARIVEDVGIDLEPMEDLFEGLTIVQQDELLSIVDQELHPDYSPPPSPIDDPFGDLIYTRQKC